MENLDKENKYIKAKERVGKIKKFYGNLLSYVVFISFLAGLNYYTDGWRNPWFLWAAFGWGIGIFFHALKVFDWNPFMGKDWEERKIQEYMNKDSKAYKKTQHWE
ncbi:2TM domain-containing protein [Aureibaculum sp. A20]|uniref:2TM domain-containing protein n=1 Tax=Aureibaculum flavum TaxID=2795986 RepID=A0ABS0WL96_9FLAO|nr:2TM domain-containing protein [Aureibaculum flavum]MBJ2172740.1 2TM domain-containing protein [Aureibaculum flavum]